MLPTPLPTRVPPRIAARAALPPAADVPPPEAEAINIELNNVQSALKNYRAQLDGNPVGTNAEITSALRGGNPKGIRIAIPQGSTVNGKGELCDRWGTPYFFHQVSKIRTEVRSAGPDREMWTGDDAQF